MSALAGTLPGQMNMFDGRTYDPQFDEDRLSCALGRVYAALADGEWLTLRQLADIAQCSEAGASARTRDLRKTRFGAHRIETRRVEGGLWEYRMVR